LTRAYYNEIDPYAAQWLRNLIDAGLIAKGDVDERDIRDVKPGDLDGYTQCHFFAGIGGWSYALRLAGWPDDRPVWTGSCPCQPFSEAGKGDGEDDERHLWPAWFHLIDVRRPPVIFGEQVASKAALPWLDLVCSDLEGASYAVGAVDLCAAGVGAPHMRQRLWFVADAERRTTERRGHDLAGAQEGPEEETRERQWIRTDVRTGRDVGELANTNGRNAGTEGLQRGGQHGQQQEDSSTVWLGDPDNKRPQGQLVRRLSADQWVAGAPGVVGGFWSGADLIYCRDGKWRPVEPGTFPLAHGIPNRVGRLRAYGNAIVPQTAAEFIAAYMEI